MKAAPSCLVGEAVPLPASAELDLTAVRQAVSEENQALAATVDQQGTTIGLLTGAVARLREGLEDAGPAPVAAPEPITIVNEPASTGVLLPVLGGVALGLAAAALGVSIFGARRKGDQVAEDQNRAMSAIA